LPAPEGKLGRAGLLVINSPYGFQAAAGRAALIARPLEAAIRAG
jgi:hypothetical protein